jgi:two-component system, LuxR family, response regulator FixJ
MRPAERRSSLGVVESGREAGHDRRHQQGISMGLSNLVVYLVDDDVSIRRALTRLLKSLGIETVVFASAEAFLQAGPWASEACLILDVQMPGMKGWDLLEHLRAAGIVMPVIIITAYNDAQTHDRALQAGIVAYLQKPFDDQTLLEILRQAHEQRHRGSA